jgi:ferritin
MISQTMQQAINEQIKNELESAYLYQAMAAWFHSIGFDGMGQWMRAQAGEELAHATKFFDHLLDREGTVVLQALGQPPRTWESPLAAFEAALEHEKFITGKIHELVDTATSEKDHAANILLQWFVTEQVEEEATAGKIVDTLKKIGDSTNGQYMLDRELGRRQAAG